MRRTKIVATIGPASRDPEVMVRMLEAGMDVARLNFSHGTLRRARRDGEAAARRRRAGGPPARNPPGPPRPQAAHRVAGRRCGRAEAGRAGDAHVRQRGDRRQPAVLDPLGRAGQRPGAGRGRLPRRRRGAAAGGGRARWRGRGGRRRGGGRRDHVPPGRQRARRGRRAALGAGARLRVPALRGADRRRPGGALLRAPGRGRRGGAKAHPPAAGGQDREAPGGRAPGGHPPASPTA